MLRINLHRINKITGLQRKSAFPSCLLQVKLHKSTRYIPEIILTQIYVLKFKCFSRVQLSSILSFVKITKEQD